MIPLVNPSVSISEVNPDLNLLIKRADQKGLYDDRYWQILLHYQKTWRGYRSLIDDPKFFLSPSGMRDPRSEMEATLRSFYGKDKRDDEHSTCKFIARFEWLKEQLGLADSSFSEIKCHEFKKFEDSLRPKSAVLVFPTFFMNNPASMFGHTLLRIDNGSESKLLSFAVNYAAYPNSFGPLYPIKGIFGSYKGFYSIFPYFDTVKKYNDTEQRDMWEYHLNLSEAEVQKLVWHLWELKDIYSYYYFFDENCSYNLLYLLEAARPSLHLTDKKWIWTIPSDTLRAIEEEGLVGNNEFRPSKGTKIRHIASLLHESDQDRAMKIVEQKLKPSQLPSDTPDENTKVLDLAAEEIQYQYNKHQIDKETYLKVFLSTLNARSKLGNINNDPYDVPAPIPPDAGHRSSRISLSEGIRGNSSFEEISYRPAYHSLTDPDEGFAKGMQIDFADTTVRAYNNGSVKLESFDLIDIMSLSPRDRFFEPLSYKITTGFYQQMTQTGDDRLVYLLNPGIGMAFENRWAGLIYGLGEVNLDLSKDFKDLYALGGGLQVGAINQITDQWKSALSFERFSYPVRNVFQENRASLVQTYRLNQNNSLNLSFLWDEMFHHDRTEGQLKWNYYF
ncbi:MAG: DUF4105 domain-containing protein [Nitrospiria bacterium]